MWSWRPRGFALAKASGGLPTIATGVSEARWVRGCVTEDVAREPGPPAEADRCAVKRPVPQSPFPGTQALGSERSASFEEMLGTREARVLVVEKQWEAEVGWNASRFVLLRPVARRVKGGDLAHRRPSYLLTRTTEVHPLHGWAAKGGQASASCAGFGRRDDRSFWRPSEAVRRSRAGTSQGRHDAWFCPASRGVGPAWLKCARVCGGRQKFRYDGRRLESFLHLLATRRWLLIGEGTVERFWSLGKTDLARSRVTRGAGACGRRRRCAGAEGRQGTSEVGTHLVKALPAPRERGVRRVSIQDVERRRRSGRRGFGQDNVPREDRGCMSSGSTEADASE